ncbi:hypothetical protein IWQ61_010218 [Dispira simplex]|nr:hypothetical protein IWQ61_010218 [Dispira simplex]
MANEANDGQRYPEVEVVIPYRPDYSVVPQSPDAAPLRRSRRLTRGRTMRSTGRQDSAVPQSPNAGPLRRSRRLARGRTRRSTGRQEAPLSFPSGSNWDESHLDALHVEITPDYPMEGVVPLNYCPENLLHRMRAFWALDREDLYNGNVHMLATVIDEATDARNRSLTTRISSGVYACMDAITSLIGRYQGDDSYESGTDDEGEGRNESFTNKFAATICENFLTSFTQLQRRVLPSWEYRTPRLRIQHNPDGTSCTVCPDGVIQYAPDRYSRIPYVWVEVKPLSFAPGRRQYRSTLPQKVAEAIAMAEHQPREVFGIEFSHRFVAFWRTIIPENYLERVRNSEGLPPDMILEMRRSAVLDFVSQNDRYEFARACLALLMYLNEQVVRNE